MKMTSPLPNPQLNSTVGKSRTSNQSSIRFHGTYRDNFNVDVFVGFRSTRPIILMQVYSEISTYKLNSQLTLRFQKPKFLKWYLVLNP